MRSINKVIIIGNLTRAPEMRQTPNGQTVTTFGIATNREWITKNGERKNSAEFHECVAWAKLAEICQKYLQKGRLVYVEGYLKTRNWMTPEQTKKFKTEIVIQDMIMLEKKNNEEEYIPNEDVVSEETDVESKNHFVTESPKENIEQPTARETSTSKSEENPIDKDLGL